MKLVILYEGKGIKIPADLDQSLQDKAKELIEIQKEYYKAIYKAHKEGHGLYHPHTVGKSIKFIDPHNKEKKEVYVDIAWISVDAHWLDTYPPTLEISLPKKKLGEFKDYFKYYYNLLVHEIIHEIDPRCSTHMNTINLLKRMKKGGNQHHQKTWDDYIYDPNEVVAWASELANYIKKMVDHYPEKRNDVLNLLKHRLLPDWLEKYKDAISHWCTQPKFWKKRVAPVIWDAIT